MAAFDWKALVRGVAPTIGTALGGPLAGMALKAVTTAVLGQPGTEEQLAAALETATPDQLAALKKVDNDFAKEMKALDIDLERIHAGDRDSARRREVDGRDPWTPRILALTIAAGAAAVSAAVFLAKFGSMDPTQSALIGAVVGYVFNEMKAVSSYYFGSSAGSAQKTAMLGK